ncbi:MAG: hypothetical protein JNJ94_13325 [Chlorobi bacterium]|nr:hypothetical protein [Chlorobiota bacterium]
MARKILNGLVISGNSSAASPHAGVGLVLPVTVRNCSNTASEVSVIEATIPANTLADGHYIELRGRVEWRNLDGGSPTLTTKIKAGSSYHTLGSATIGGTGYTRVPYRVLISRRGSSLWVAGWDYAYGMAAEWHPAALNEIIGADIYASGKKGGEIASLTFSSDLTIALTAQWSAASANRYYNALDGEVLLR